jgi:hypothetical protein
VILNVECGILNGRKKGRRLRHTSFSLPDHSALITSTTLPLEGQSTERRVVWVSTRRSILCRNAHAILIPPIFLSRFAGDFTTWGCHGQNHNLGPESPSAIADKREPVISLQAGPSGFLALHEADLRQGEHPAEEWLFEAPAPWFPMDAGK